MAIKRYNPKGLYEPVAAYHQNNEVSAGARWLVTAGQVGIGTDGKLVKEPKGQIEQAWKNVAAALAGAGMSAKDLVKLTIYMTPNAAEHMQHSREARARILEGEKPGATLVYVAGLADPDMVIEIDVYAAQ
jgi:enamine deaminase RidA (YjgF/YER057c/UK114 family)